MEDTGSCALGARHHPLQPRWQTPLRTGTLWGQTGSGALPNAPSVATPRGTAAARQLAISGMNFAVVPWVCLEHVDGNISFCFRK